MDKDHLAALGRFGRISLIDNATPIQRLHRLEQALGNESHGVRLFVKRDDLMGLGGGGNKLRKLEFLIGEALAQQCDTFITTGGLQSNHARLSAAAARTGLSCELVLTRAVPREDEEYRRNGNILLDGLFGAKIHELPGGSDALAFAEERAAALRKEGRRPYVVGATGGSAPVGCLGYAACALEIVAQEKASHGSFAGIVLPNGSSGTHAGLAAGLAAQGMDPVRLQSFSVLAPAVVTRSKTHDLARATLALLRDDVSIDASSIDVDGDQLGDGYGIPTDAMFAAVRLMARTEGLLLDPVYGGKAFAGLLAAVRKGVYQSGDAVLFLMTGGVPGLFAYRRAFDQQG